MSTENVPTTEQLAQQPGSGGRKTVLAVGRPAEQAMKCPRCDSPNTKFCYYNNYSLTQPRHFCKTCRRYWTKGGALRNVPIGGGCRKSRKIKPGSRLSNGADSRDSGSSSEVFHGIGIQPAMDFQLGNLSFHNNFASPPFGDISQNASSIIPSVPNFNIDPAAVRGGGIMGGMMNYPNPGNGINGINEFGSSNIPTSIESLSSMNQDLHWKLQQQRMAILFGGGNGMNQMNQKEIASQSAAHAQRPQPIMFQNLDRDGNTSAGAGATEWFFDNSYAPPAVNPTPTPTNSGGNGNENGGHWNGVHGWNDMNHFGRLP